MQVRGFIKGLMALILGAAIVLPAQAQTQVALGKEYVAVEPPQATESPAGKIEVLEFFSYGCIHCFRLHPFIKKWAASAQGVDFKRVPVTFDRPQMKPMAKLFYALEATGDMAKLDDLVFKAQHEQNVNLATDKSVLEWVGKQGVDMKKFTEAFNSFGVQSKVARAEQMARNYKVQGTPQVYVDGRYAVRNEGMANYEQIPLVTAELVKKAQSEKKK